MFKKIILKEYETLTLNDYIKKLEELIPVKNN